MRGPGPDSARIGGASRPAALDDPLSPAAYEWTGRFMRFLRRVLKVNIRLHHEPGQVESGDIFVFNHFARFETFIPQYLFWEQCGVHCRSIADRALFRSGDRFAAFLRSVGAVPNDHPQLLALLAAEVLRGRKLIVFPEGGMVKDRQVMDEAGEYSVYSRSAQRRRKQHSGAAVIALALEVFKSAVRAAALRGDAQRLEAWCSALGIPDPVTLLARCDRPTSIVPANITFHPMRVHGNVLQKGVELFNRGISPRLREELLVEGNILLRDTDMDIRLGPSLEPAVFWDDHERALVAHRAARLGDLGEAFTTQAERADRRLQANASRLHAERIRDAYMHAIYQLVTVNLGHVVSVTILRLLDDGHDRVDRIVFHRILYLAIKQLQREPGMHLHRGLRNPESYAGLWRGRCEGLDALVDTFVSLGLIEAGAGELRFRSRLRADHDFDRVRLENPLAVYANEVVPVRAVGRAVATATESVARWSSIDRAGLFLDDEARALAWDRRRFDKAVHRALNAAQTATADPRPFWLRPRGARSVGVLLVHGFLASPAEVRGFGETLAERGFTVLGVRLKGHGTSPWDLRSRTASEWLDSVRAGYDMLETVVDRVCVVGFSTGGSLALMLAAERPASLAGVVAIATPLRFRNRNMLFVPMVHRANRLVGTLREQGIVEFRPNASEHPAINYAHLPIRALHQLGELVQSLKKRLPRVVCPALIVQGDRDPVVEPASGTRLYRALGSADKRLCQVPSMRHGILHENVGDTWTETLAFVERCEAR